MAFSLWLNSDGEVLVNDDGAPILCESCPCNDCLELLITAINQRIVALGAVYRAGGYLLSTATFAQALAKVNLIACWFVKYPLSAEPFADTFANFPPLTPATSTQTNPYCYSSAYDDEEGTGGCVPSTVDTCEKLLAWIKKLRYAYLGNNSYNLGDMELATINVSQTTPTGSYRRNGDYAQNGSSSISFADAETDLMDWAQPNFNSNTQIADLRDEALWYLFGQTRTDTYISGVFDSSEYSLIEQETSYLLYPRSNMASLGYVEVDDWTWDYPPGTVRLYLMPAVDEIISNGQIHNFGGEFSDNGEFSLYDSMEFGSTDSINTNVESYGIPTTTLGWGQPCEREIVDDGDLVLYDTIVDGDTTHYKYGISGVGADIRWQWAEEYRGMLCIQFDDITDLEWDESSTPFTCTTTTTTTSA